MGWSTAGAEGAGCSIVTGKLYTGSFLLSWQSSSGDIWSDVNNNTVITITYCTDKLIFHGQMHLSKWNYFMGICTNLLGYISWVYAHSIEK